MWRRHYQVGTLNNGALVKLNLQNAADMVGVPRKTLEVIKKTRTNGIENESIIKELGGTYQNINVGNYRERDERPPNAWPKPIGAYLSAPQRLASIGTSLI